MRRRYMGMLAAAVVSMSAESSAQVVTKTTPSPKPATTTDQSKAPAQGKVPAGGPGQSTPQGKTAAPAAGAPSAAAKAGLTDAVQKLMRERDAKPDNAGANRALGIALYKLGKYQDARPALEMARQLDPTDGVSALYAGLNAEQLKDYPAAKTAYNDYILHGKTDNVRSDIQARLILITKLELKADAKRAVANEKSVGQVESNPNTIAVLPLRFTGTDASLAPLERGMADLIITDLKRSEKLTVVERDQMQAISDELALGKSGRVDRATAVRTGRIIQAGRIIQGALTQIGPKSLALSANIVSTATSESEGQPSQDGALDRLFTIEKEFVLATFAAMKIELTPAQRQAIDTRPTTSIQAFLSYSRGLQAEDAGKYDEAAKLFENARTIDPQFKAAESRQQTSSSTAQATQVSLVKVESNIRASASEGTVVQAAEKGQVVNTQPAQNAAPAAAAPAAATTTDTKDNTTKDDKSTTSSSTTTGSTTTGSTTTGSTTTGSSTTGSTTTGSSTTGSTTTGSSTTSSSSSGSTTSSSTTTTPTTTASTTTTTSAPAATTPTTTPTVTTSVTSPTLSTTLNQAAGGVVPTITNTVAATTTTNTTAATTTTTTTTTTTSTPPTTRDATGEKTGTDTPAARTGSVTIVIKKP